jgi:pimeloyl-ACP methyl ester carboxylesterase
MKQRLFRYKNSQVSYYRFGTGPQAAICFHGYGEDATSYAFLEKYLGERFSLYAIELPFHGHTDWQEGLLFTHEDLQQITEGILGLDSNPSTSPGTRTIYNKLILLGFSLGGRIAVSLYQSQPEKVSRLILMAPDGLKVNFWYWLSTQTWLGNKLFALTMKKPGWFFGLLKVFNKLKLVNASIFKFVNYYIGDPEARRLLYARWISLRKLKPNLKRVKSFVRQQDTPVRLIYGKHDRIILSSVGEKFKHGIEDHCEIKIIHSGHQVLHEKHIEELLPILTG